MKKTTALFLSVVLLLTTVIAAIPLSAITDVEPIKATPINYTIPTQLANLPNCAETTYVSPLDFTVAKGRYWKVKEGQKFQVDSMYSGTALGERFAPAATVKPATTDTHFMFYVETDGPLTIYPHFSTGNGHMFLKKNAKVSILKDGESEWSTLDTVNYPAETTGINGTVYGAYAIEFDEAFKGLVKIAYADIGNGEASNYLNAGGNNVINFFQILLKGIGSGYGYADNVKVGPFFNVTSDSNSAVIEVPKEFRPQPDPIQATPVVYSVSNQFSLLPANAATTSVTPLDYTIAQGRSWKLNEGKQCEVDVMYAGSPIGERYTPSNFKPAETDTHFMFYLETDGPITIYPTFQTGNGVNMFLKKNATVQKLGTDDLEWSSLATVNYPLETTNAKGDFGTYAIELDAAFKGYIKIAYTDIGNEDASNYLNAGGNNTVNYFQILLKGMGKELGYTDNVTVGPFFTVTKDTESDTIEVPVEFQPVPEAEPLEATPMTYTVTNTFNIPSEKITDGFQPLDYTIAVGQKWELDGHSHQVPANMFCGAGDALGQRFALANFKPAATDTHFMFYLETDGPVTFLPHFRTSTSANFFINKNAKVRVLEDGADTWKDLKVVDCSEPTNAGDYCGVIELDAAFKGYIKIAYADLGNSATEGFADGANALEYWQALFKALGAAKGAADNVVIGPFFNVTKDTESTKIKVPAKYSAEPLEADAFKVGYVSNWTQYMTGTEVTPLTDTTANGVKWTLNKDKDFLGSPDNPDKVISNNTGSRFELKSFLVLDEQHSHFMFYVETNGPTRLAARFVMGDGKQYQLKKGCTVQMFDMTENKWIDVKTVECGDEQGEVFGGDAIPFTDSFKGYVKIAYTDIGIDGDGEIYSKPDTAYTLKAVDLFVGAMGTVENVKYADEITVGPFFSVTNNSDYPEFKFNDPEVAQPKPTNGTLPSTVEPLKIGSVNAGLGVTIDDAPLTYTDVFGVKFSKTKNFETKGAVVTNNTGSRFEFTETPLIPASEEYIMFRIETDGKLVLYPRFYTTEYVLYYLRRKCKVQLLADGENSWVTVDTVKTDDTAGATFGGYAIQLDGEFSGYVKIAWSDIGDMDKNEAFHQYDDESYGIRTVDLFVKGMGGAYASKYTVGPFFRVTKDSKDANVGTKLLTLNYNSAWTKDMSYEEVYPTTPYTTEYGKKFTLNSGKDFYSVNADGRGVNALSFTMANATVFKDDNFIIFRYAANGAATFSPVILSNGREYAIKSGATVQVLKDGNTEWETISTTGTTKPQIKFDEAFEGYIRIAYTDLDGGGISTKTNVSISRIDFYINGMGTVGANVNATELTVGPFFTYYDKDVAAKYTADNVWNKSDLPEMKEFDVSTGLTAYSYYGMGLTEISSPIPTIGSNNGFWISNTPGVNLTISDVLSSPYTAYQAYDYMPMGNITHIMIYVKVPESQSNMLTLSIWTGKDNNKVEFKILKNSLYALLPLGETEWQHYYTAYPGVGNYGAFELPAGFEGFLKIPLTTLQPGRSATPTTEIYSIGYRFSYLGTGSEQVLVGPVFGVTKDNDPGPAEVVLTELPPATTILRPFMIEDGDIFPDKIMLSWQAYEGAKEYSIDAYLVQKNDEGKTYKLVNSVRTFTNSGTVTGLEKETQYAFVINAKDATGGVIATYDGIVATTSAENMYVTLQTGGQIPKDSVLYPDGEGSFGGLFGGSGDGSVNVWVIIGICAAGLVLVAGIVTVTLIVIKKRRKTNA